MQWSGGLNTYLILPKQYNLICRIFGIAARSYCRMMRHNASVTRYRVNIQQTNASLLTTSSVEQGS